MATLLTCEAGGVFGMIVSVFLNLAIVLAFLKGGDLILRSHQRRKVQSFLEDMTLRVEELDFQQISQRMTTPEAQYCFIVLAYAEFTFRTVAGLVLNSGGWKPGGEFTNMYGTAGYYIEVGTVIFSFLFLGICWRWPVPQLMSLIVGQKNSWPVILLRFTVTSVLITLLTAALYVAILVCGHYAVGIPISENDPSSNVLRMICTLPVSPIFLVSWIVFQAIGTLLQARMFYVRWLFLGLRAVLWRIVEYEKGAFAAVLVVATVVVSILKEVS